MKSTGKLNYLYLSRYTSERCHLGETHANTDSYHLEFLGLSVTAYRWRSTVPGIVAVCARSALGPFLSPTPLIVPLAMTFTSVLIFRL